MWNAITQIMTNSNGVVSMLCIAVIVIVSARYGLLKIKTDKLTIGRDSSDRERQIIRVQSEYVEIAAEAFEMEIPKYDGYDYYHGKFVVEKVIDAFNKNITQNHINTGASYILVTQKKIWKLIQSLVVNDMYRTEEFKQSVDEFVADVIENLVRIRKEYSKSK